MPFYPSRVKARTLWTPKNISPTAWYDASDDSTITRAGTALRCQLGLLTFSGINPFTGAAWRKGDTYRIMFVTEALVTAESADGADYDAIVQAEAEAAGLGQVTWKAHVSTPTEDARDRCGARIGVDYDGPIYDIDGTLVASKLANMYSGQDAKINETVKHSAKRLTVPLSNDTVLWTPWSGVWTGTAADGTADQPMGGGTGTVTLGIINAEDQFLFDRANDSRFSAKLHLHAMSPVLSVHEVDLVSQIDDKIGTNHLTQTTEASRAAIGARKINGRNCLDFLGSNNDYDFTSGIDMLNKMAFMVLASDKYTEQQVENNGNSTQTRLQDIGAAEDGRQIRFAGADQTTDYDGFGANVETSLAMQFFASTPYVMGWAYDDPLYVYRDGRVEQVADRIATNSITTIRFGNYSSDTAALDGALCEYIITPLLSTADRLRMEGYLAHKWGATDRLSAAHPYKTNPPRYNDPVVAGSWTPDQMDPLAWLEFAWDKNNYQASSDNQIDGVSDITAPDKILLQSSEGNATSRYPAGAVLGLEGCSNAANNGLFEVESASYGTVGNYAIDEFDALTTNTYIYFDAAEGDITHRFEGGSTLIVTGAAQGDNNRTCTQTGNPLFTGGRTRITVQGVGADEGPGSAASGALQATTITTVETSLVTEVVDPEGYAKTVRVNTLYDKAGFRRQASSWGVSAGSGKSKGSVRDNILNDYRVYDNEQGGYASLAIAAPSSGDYGILMVARLKAASGGYNLRSGSGGSTDFEIDPATGAGSDQIAINYGAALSTQFATPTLGDGEFHIIGIRFDFTDSGKVTGRLDGAVDAPENDYVVKLDFTTGLWLSNAGQSGHPHVQIAEWIEFEDVSIENFERLEGYLAWKWGLQI